MDLNQSISSCDVGAILELALLFFALRLKIMRITVMTSYRTIRGPATRDYGASPLWVRHQHCPPAVYHRQNTSGRATLHAFFFPRFRRFTSGDILILNIAMIAC